MDIGLDSTVQRNGEILFTDLDDTVVMMDPDKGTYYELDTVGTRIWSLLDTGRSVKELCDLLVETTTSRLRPRVGDARERDIEPAPDLLLLRAPPAAALSRRRITGRLERPRSEPGLFQHPVQTLEEWMPRARRKILCAHPPQRCLPRGREAAQQVVLHLEKARYIGAADQATGRAGVGVSQPLGHRWFSCCSCRRLSESRNLL